MAVQVLPPPRSGGGGGAPAPAWIPLRYADRIADEDTVGTRVTGIVDDGEKWTVSMTSTGVVATTVAARWLGRFAVPDGFALDGRSVLMFRVRRLGGSDASGLQPYVTVGVTGSTAGRIAGSVRRHSATAIRVQAISGTTGIAAQTANAEANLADGVARWICWPGSNLGREGPANCEVLGSAGTQGRHVLGDIGTALFSGTTRIEVGIGHGAAGTAGQTCTLEAELEMLHYRVPA